MEQRIFDLSGKTALVTGGGRGLGRAMALGLADAGAEVAIADLLSSEAKGTADAVLKKGRKAMAFTADITRANDVHGVVSEVTKVFGKIDILINNAGINLLSPAEDFPLEDWQKVLAVNLTGVFLCAQAVGRVMIDRKKGKIINIASVAGLVGTPHDAVAYNSTKAGVISLTRSLAVEWGEYGINVNAIAPGMIETDLTRKRLENKDYYDYWMRTIPLKRVGRPQDLVGAVIYLSSEASDWMTGQVVVIDGGYTAM
jgi:NAD(P)-dependent dehydrogenase (short-subunit alcohol dehydrogenase family)